LAQITISGVFPSGFFKKIATSKVAAAIHEIRVHLSRLPRLAVGRAVDSRGFAAVNVSNIRVN